MGEAKTALDLGHEMQRAAMSRSAAYGSDQDRAVAEEERARLEMRLAAIDANSPEQIAVLKNELTLAKASCRAAGSLLLEVQRDCVEQRQRATRAEAAVAALQDNKPWLLPWTMSSGAPKIVALREEEDRCVTKASNILDEEIEAAGGLIPLLEQKRRAEAALAALEEENETHAALDDTLARAKKAEQERNDLLAKHTALVEALETNLVWVLGGYDGPDYIEHAENSTWRLASAEHFSVNVMGNEPPGSIAEFLQHHGNTAKGSE